MKWNGIKNGLREMQHGYLLLQDYSRCVDDVLRNEKIIMTAFPIFCNVECQREIVVFTWMFHGSFLYD